MLDSTGSENLRAPRGAVGAEESVRARERAQLLDAARALELREREAAEVDRAERRHVEAEVRPGARPRRRPALELPPPFVPRAERVGDLEDDGAVAAVGGP